MTGTGFGLARWRRLPSPPSPPFIVAVLAPLLAGCLGGGPGAIIAAAPPAAAPLVTGAAPAVEADHVALAAAFGGEYRAPALKTLVMEVVERLVPRTERPNETYSVTLLDSPKVNAFALPSGRLYVTRGLLALASDLSEVAAVISHEVAHVTLRHASFRSEREARDVLVSRVVADVLNDPNGGAALRQRARASLAGFSRDQELEADRVGVATLAAAGYDPHAAARFLRALGRQAQGDEHIASGQPDGLSSHPSTPERVALALAAARRVGAPGEPRPDERERYLAALDGTLVGDRVRDGLVRGRTFVHPRLGVTVTAPPGMTLDNTSRALLGATADGRTRFLFDAVEAPAGQGLSELLATSWTDALEPGSARTVVVNERPVALAASTGREWTFRLAAIRVGATTYRVILAGRGGPGRGATAAALEGELDNVLAGVLASLREVGPDEAARLRPHRIAIHVAGAGDTPDGLAARMTADLPIGRFLVLNGLEPGAALVPGRSYKLVVE